MVIGDEQLQVPQYDIPEYDPDIIDLAIDNPTEEFMQLRKDLETFVNKNKQYFTVASMAKLLGTSTGTLSKLISDPQGFNSQKAQTVLVLRSVDSMDSDDIKFKAGLI